MCASLANVYADMLRLHGDNFTVSYAPPPSYLLNIVGEDEAQGKIVLLYKEDRNKASALALVSPRKLQIQKPNAVDLDLTGSPLKDDCVVDTIADLSLDLKVLQSKPWQLDEECHTGIDVEKARAIINSQRFQAADAKTKGAVWFLCNGKDAERTLLLQYEFVTEYAHFSRGIITYQGEVSAADLQATTLLKQHFAPFQPKQSVQTLVQNTYMLNANSCINCAWTTLAKEPALLDLSKCDIVLTQTFCLQNCNVHTQDFMDQLRLLMLLRDDILAYKSAQTQKEPTYRCGRGIDMQELQQSIAKVLHEMSGFADIDSANNTDADLEGIVYRAKLRRLTDLTDKLWDILKRCATYADLKMAFFTLFQMAARCNVVNAPQNNNRLAEIIIEIANRRLAIPCLTGSEPLELLLEIGLEKLYKDYEYIFTESKLSSAKILRNLGSAEANTDDDAGIPNVRKSLRNAVRSEVGITPRKTLLHDFNKKSDKFPEKENIGFKNSNFNEGQTAVTLAKLLQIHCTLEHLLMLHATLNLNNVYTDICEQLLKRPLHNIERMDDSLVDKMQITLSAHELGQRLDGQEPHSRRITMVTKNKFRELKTTFYYNRENICPPNINDDEIVDEKDLLKENCYYAWMYKKIKSVVPNAAAAAN